jgi:hypothetical protein
MDAMKNRSFSVDVRNETPFFRRSPPKGSSTTKTGKNMHFAREPFPCRRCASHTHTRFPPISFFFPCAFSNIPFAREDM